MSKLAMRGIVAVTTLVAVSASSAQTVAYTPGTARYRVTTIDSSSQEVQGQTQSYAITSMQVLTVTLAPKSRDTLQYTISLDSVSLTSSAPTPVADANKLRGVRVSGLMSPTGQRYTTEVSDTSAEGAGDVARGLQRFLIALPAGAKGGTTWPDSTSLTNNSRGAQMAIKTVTTYRVAGDTTVAGQRAWRIERTGTVSQSGTGVSQGASFTIERAGSLAGTMAIAANGRFLGGVATQKLTGKVSLPSYGMEIPQTSNVVTRVEMLK